MLKERDRENSEALKSEYIAELNRKEVMLYEGGKGGEEKAHTPVETPNNLLSVAYAKVLVAVGEGEFAGQPTGRDIYLNGTPLINANGDENFGGVTWEWRSGAQDQTYIQGMPEASNEISVGVEVTQLNPWVQQISKTSLSAARVTLQFPALMQQMENGDTVGYTIDYAIDLSTDGGPFTLYQQYQVSGKTNSVYERTHSVTLPESGNGWTLRVRRITPNSQSSLIQDKMNLKSFAEVIDAKQTYPNTALLFVQFDSRLFGGGTIPKISVNTEGRVIRIPSNYDPESRTYTGTWDGSFKWGWTDNPAWVFFDIVTQDRFGLGSRVTTNQVDKWELYEVSQYCDVMVDDGTGAGTKEPRHTCNMYIQSQTDAWSVLRDICSIFNGMTYWNGNQFVAIADKLEPIDNIPLFGRANVINGEFNYTATDERTIFTSALVSYDEPTDHYSTQVEAVWEKSEILRWGGDRQTTMAAIGCTSRGEAQRKGKYTLLTNMFNRTVTFKTGLQGLDEKIKPGGIIGVADPLISGKSFTGRIKVATPTVVTLDRPTEAKAGDLLFVTLKDGSQQARTIKQSTGNIVTVTTAYSEALLPNATWYLESSDLKSQLFKVVKLTSPDESVYEITAVEYNTSKYGAIDNGARLEPRPISKVPPQAQKKPEPVTITSNTFIEQTMAVTTMTITYPQTENAVLYEGQWRIGQGDWVDLGTTGALEFNVRGIYTGKYLARVRAINALGIKSQWSLSATTDLQGKVGLPASLASLTTTPLIFGIRLNWAFPNGVEDTARTEIMYSRTASFTDAIKLGDFAYPQDTHDINGLAAGTTFYFWGRLADRSGNVGPYFPLTSTFGVQGISSTNVADYEEYFRDQINESALGQDLAAKIDKIDTIEIDVSDLKIDVEGLHKDVADVNGSVNWIESQLSGIESQLQNDIENVNNTLQGAIDITNADLGDLKDDVNDLNAEVGDLQDQVNNITDALKYDPSKTYTKGDTVREGQKLYQAIGNVPIGMSPPNPTYWKDVGDIITDLGALTAQVNTNTLEITQQGNTITAHGQQISALDVRVGTNEQGVSGNTTAINNLSATVTQQGNTITSQGQAITALESDVSSLQTGQSGNATAIESLRTTVTQQGDLITSQGQAITTLGATVDTLQTDVNGVKLDIEAQGSAITGLTTTVTQQGNTISSHSNSITALEGKVNTITTDLDGLETKVDANSTAVTNLQNTVTQQGNTITAQGQDITTLKADVSTVTTDLNGLKTTVTGQGTAISNLQTTVTQQGNDIAANSNSITALTAEVKFNALDALYNGAETEQQIEEALNIASGAASATQSLTAEVTKQGDVINAQAQSITELKASLTNIDGVIVGQGTAIEDLKTITTSQGNTITSQGQSITQLNNSLTLVDGKATDALSKADSALTQLTTKADASAVTALTTRVTNAEGVITSQGQSITQLNNSLTITNNNVTAAQQAAQAASDKAGAKGEVIYGTTAPAADKRLPQNLWIDTTNGANTPKRWLTNAWVTVTDKVATDAAAAAADALAKVATKADSSALTSLTNTVTQQGNTITAQGQSITNLTASLKVTDDKVNLKADASTVQALTNTVTQQGEDITANTNALTALETEVTFSEIDELYSGAETDQQIAEAFIIASGAASATQSLNSSVTQLQGVTTAQGQSITELKASLTGVTGDVLAQGTAISNLQTLTTAQGNTITSQGQDITTLNNSLTITNGNVTAAQNAANAANTLAGGKGKVIVQAAEPAVADRLAQNLWIDMTGGANTPKRWTGSAWVAVTDKVATDAAAAAANALSQVALKADASAVQTLTTRVTNVEGTVTSQGQALTQLTTRITNAETGITGNATAISNTNTKVTEIDGKIAAVSTRVDGVYAQVNPDLAGSDSGMAGNSTSLVGVWSEQSARIEGDMAVGQRIDNVQVTVGENDALIQQTSKAVVDLDGKASAMWSVKLQVNSQGQYVAAGVGLGIENTGAGLQSTFLVSADKFAVVNGANATLSTPFVVQSGQVFIKDAFIQNGSINMLKIGDNLQSDDYIAGTQGWKLSKGGNIEFNGTVAGGGRLTMSNRLIQVYDENGTRRVRLGIF